VDRTAGLDGCREHKISYYPLGWFRTAASRYTDYAIPAANDHFQTLVNWEDFLLLVGGKKVVNADGVFNRRS